MKALLKKIVGLLGLLCHLVFSGCSPEHAPDQVLQVVTVKQFEKFVAETGYVTDAEQFGWSIVQKDVFNFTTVDGANWRNPDGLNPPASPSLPVTQVSYNDAVAYCKWSRTALPTYEQYWELIQPDERMVVTNLNAPISSAETVNILGNVWEITAPVDGEAIRLAGGSLFCSPRTCHGTSKARKLYVDKQTGNLHIGFAVILAVQ
ncbi:MAG: SUMF1/EgtB/PvdO family nonheme iron enzyme [Bacteroidota bacterium]